MIGVFDSGIGGLTVVKKIFEALPEYQILYFGDTARTPYGNRGEEIIKKYALEDAEILVKNGTKIIVVACHTASAIAMSPEGGFRPRSGNFLRQQIELPLFDVVTPATEKAIKLSKNGRIGVIGTRTTINSKIYERLIKQLNPKIQVYQNAAPLLVSLVEEGWLKNMETKRIVKKYLFPLKSQQIDTLILACTHYPFLKEIIQRKIGRQVKLVDPAEEVALKLKEFLVQKPEIEQSLTKGSQHRFLVSDLTPHFQELAKKWLGQEIKLQKIEI